jgi:hypothetical protein
MGSTNLFRIVLIILSGEWLMITNFFLLVFIFKKESQKNLPPKNLETQLRLAAKNSFIPMNQDRASIC